jgi:iron complex transport system substrate-binding protein
MAHELDSTRRRFLTSGALLGTGLLAGCTGESGSGSGGEATTAGGETSGTNESTATSANETTGETTEKSSGGGSYTVSMAPVGEVTLEGVPERGAQYFPGYADMTVALGQADTITAVGSKSRYYTSYYDALDGVSVDKDSMTELVTDSGIDKEIFYELDSDVHLIDPRWLIENSAFALEQADIEEVSQQIAPFVGNTIFRRTDEWHSYRYYTMYEAFEKVAQVFQQEERYRKFKSFHDEYLGRVTKRLPPEGERPKALLTYGDGNRPEEFSPYRLSDQGTNKKQFHDLGVEDALAGTGIEGLSTTDRGTIDYETMLEVDPEVLLVRGHEDKTPEQFRDTVVQFMESHPVASRLSAVRSGRVFRGGPIYEGPIQNLFLTERFAKDLYPETYTEEQLFDRQRVAAIVDGDHQS